MATQPQTGMPKSTIHPGTVQRDKRPPNAGAPKQAMRVPQLPWLDFSPVGMQQRSRLQAQNDIATQVAGLPSISSIQQQYEPGQKTAVELGNAVADHLRAAGQWQAGLGQAAPSQAASTLGAPVAQAAPAAGAGQALAYGQANALGSAGDAASLRGLAQSQMLQSQESRALGSRAAQESAIQQREPGLEAGYLDRQQTLANQQNIARYNGAIAMLQTEANLGVKQSQILADLKKAQLAYGLGQDKLGVERDYNAGQLSLGQSKLDAEINHWSAQDKARRIQAAAAYLRAQNGGSSASSQDEKWLLRGSAAADKALAGQTTSVPSGQVRVTYSTQGLDPRQPPQVRTVNVPAASAKNPAAAQAYLTGTLGLTGVKVGEMTPVTTKKTQKGDYQSVYNAALQQLRIHYSPQVAQALALRIAKERMNPVHPPGYKPPPEKPGPRSPNAPG